MRLHRGRMTLFEPALANRRPSAGAAPVAVGSGCSLAARPPLAAAAAKARELVRRETVADLLARDRGWSGHPDEGESRCMP